MNTRKNYPYHVVFKQNEDLDGAEIAGTRYYVHTAVRFTANGIGWLTDFENLVRDPVLDEH